MVEFAMAEELGLPHTWGLKGYGWRKWSDSIGLPHTWGLKGKLLVAPTFFNGLPHTWGLKVFEVLVV